MNRDLKGIVGGSQRPGFSAEGRTSAEALRGNGLECLGGNSGGGMGMIGSECEEVTEVTGARTAEPVVFQGLCSTPCASHINIVPPFVKWG